ncbi:E3 ubiquitin-protein ligase rnf213-alpha-like [Dreissena polymorpha]|uniref:E3 ubiquitin-protein ligase rnf213-alpha-like n=1 Tax=Dreissena polymorpha TaxID=45954 RepID=UPI0022643AD8|nr:E3 ubiquitin-protein ligase rnf213-alpha-like [Dreissena polymorpha]
MYIIIMHGLYHSVLKNYCLSMLFVFIDKHQSENALCVFSEECVGKVQRLWSVAYNTRQSILTGSIVVEVLEFVSEHVHTFCDFLSANCSDKETIRLTKQIIRLRMQEVHACKHHLRIMTQFVNLCETYKVDTSGIKIILQKRIEELKLADICDPQIATIVRDGDDYEPDILVFKSFQTIVDVLKTFEACCHSRVFQRLWYDFRKDVKQDKLTVDDVVQTLWSPIHARYQVFTEELMTGEMMFSDFEHILGVFKSDSAELFQEISICGISDDVARKRIVQFNEIKQILCYAEGASTILDLQNVCELRGNFTPISNIVAQTKTTFKLNDVDENLKRTNAILKDMSTEKSNCLKSFTECRELVAWLKSSGQKELNVFVELAIMSAGDDHMNIGKLRCLHSAVIGYSPLIFELNPECDYEELLEKCGHIWNALNVNPRLPEQLIDSNRELPWLLEIKKAHGSVEKSALMQAEAINSYGIFIVGLKDTENKTHEKVTSEDITELHLTENKKQYTYTQLQDLHSRLMLVAGPEGQSQENIGVGVERFTSIFDSVTRLGIGILNLMEAGCILFNGWKGHFWCDPERPICVDISFWNDAEMPTLKAHSSDSRVEEIIPEIAQFLENCLKDWLLYIRSMRTKHYNLNHFTTNQLVFLQRELVQTSPSHLVYPLLSAVKKGCTPEDLRFAMISARTDIERQPSILKDTGHQLGYTDETMQNAQVIDMRAKKEEFVQKVVLAGFEPYLAQLSLDNVDEEDIIAGHIAPAILWCMDNDGMSENMGASNLLVETDANSTLKSFIETNLRSQRDTNGQGEVPLITDIRSIWKNFLDSVKSSISDFLSLGHLGIVLRHLAAKGHDEIMQRKVADIFKMGEPNLIVCSQGEVLNVTLSIYMYDKVQSLPSSDEVLLCDANTTSDEVDIFWRRAMGSDGNKIYCLMNADLLSGVVGEAADRSLHDVVLETSQTIDNLKYRLVIVCSSENEYRCPIVSSLDKYIRQVHTIDQNAVKAYIKDKLVVQKNPAASSVDFERSSVRIVKSNRAGVGKSLFVTRRAEHLQSLFSVNKTIQAQLISIPLHEKYIDLGEVIQALIARTPEPGMNTARLFHVNIAHEVQEGIDFLLFNLIILGCLVDRSGLVWRRNTDDLYLIETMPIFESQSTNNRDKIHYAHPIFGILPEVTCRSPKECKSIYANERPIDYSPTDQLFDDQQFKSLQFQRTFQYLQRLKLGKSMSDVNPARVEGNKQNALSILLECCGAKDPSWSELTHFVRFLNKQLSDYEQNVFVGPLVAGDLPGFANFVLRFLLQMSKDFATQSFNMSDESQGSVTASPKTTGTADNLINQFSLRRTWESSPHPYLFFNYDHETFTFLGFIIERGSGNMIDKKSNAVLDRAIMTTTLYDALVRNKVPLQENFDNLDRKRKIEKLCQVMGVKVQHDPDKTYELTTDNVKKILAIYMRFRCDIPVIIMGETGCGKTRLVKFMCALQCPPYVDITNMILMKVHGGTNKDDITRKVHAAEKIAKENSDKYGSSIYTVLFFDEANTTEAIGVIKEILCDGTICGEPLTFCKELKIIAACNPYRKHTNELIKKLEQAGLGYHVDANETSDRFGQVPMRRLVYRVQPLPQSILPLVWDFGQLNTNDEKLYIQQMVRRYVEGGKLPNIKDLNEVISEILTVSQQFMRNQKDECSFVSLRDVERVLTILVWFDRQFDNTYLFKEMNKKLLNSEQRNGSTNGNKNKPLDDLTRCLVLSIGVCYHACLRSRANYRETVARAFRAPCPLPGGADQILEEIECCQDVFLDNVTLEKNIARNTALKENVFMMVVCIELRIPLFLVGKPGSSKSLTKTIVADAMQGKCAKFPLFRQLKQVHMIPYQCSPLSTPQGIVDTFKECAQFQKEKDLNSFVSVVVLDEVGLAEDSRRMPLKTLHPLLEDGCQGDENPEAYKKVAFVGLSNWALDPAKMNRGILVQREVPDTEELKQSARGICQTNEAIQPFMEPLIEPLTLAYLEVFREASEQMREFFGLRDFYRESRYLLLLTDNYGALSIIQKQLFKKRSEVKPITIFGSSFRSDQEYTQVCRNINKIKSCMETGKTVILLNLENVYESLYDALNQYYVYYGGERYVDLGLGTHRLKCTVHKNFRLIVVAEKDTVYTKFPIPLINRLEKHFLTMKSILDERQSKLANALDEWARSFAIVENIQRQTRTQRTVRDVFVGFQEDTCSAIIMQVFENDTEQHITDENALEEGKACLLWCATPELLLCDNKLDRTEREKITNCYYERQAHCSFIQYLKHKLEKEECVQLFAQVTCHSKLLPANHDKEILKEVQSLKRVEIVSLSSFDTEQLFSTRVEKHLASNNGNGSLLIIQCESGDVNSKLIACARYCVMDEIVKTWNQQQTPVCIVFIIQLPRKAGGCFSDFQCGVWHSAHIDDLYAEYSTLPQFNNLQGMSVSEIFSSCLYADDKRYTLASLDTSSNIQPNPKSHVDSNLELFRLQRVSIKNILRTCIQPALSMVKDSCRGEQRATKRIEIVLQSFGKDIESIEKSKFTTGIISWIVKLFREKEKESDLHKYWLAKQAAGIETINKNGTFRRSFCSTIVAKVTPVLAGIFTFLDKNSNMDMAICDAKWKRNFWLKCIGQNDTLPLTYNDCLPSSNSSGTLEEMLVVGTGCADHEFKLRFPFSWIIITVLEEAYSDFATDADEDDETIEKCVSMLTALPIGQCVTEIDATEDSSLLTSVLQDYIHDFVKTVYRAESIEELKIVCDTVMLKTINICIETGNHLEILHRIVCSRLAWNEVSLTMKFFRSINQVWPECIIRINEFTESKKYEVLFEEHRFISSTLCLLIENLNPKSQELDNEDSRQKWLNKVYRYRPVVETILNDSRHGVHHASQRLAKSLWSRVTIMKLFIENICTTTSERSITIKYCTPLWTLLGDDVDLGSHKSLIAVEKFLKACNKAAHRQLIGPAAKCGQCGRFLTCTPVTMPCRSSDLLCQSCFTEMKTLNALNCPICKETIEKDWEPNIKAIEESKRIGIEKFEQYQKRCNTFFLEIISQLCFANGVAPSEDVLNTLLGYVTYTSESGMFFTKNLNIFDTGLDANPVFRSFLLQLILRSSEERYVTHYLGQFSGHAKLHDTTASKDVIDMYMLILQCWEDRQFQVIGESESSRLGVLCNLLHKSQTIFNSEGSKSTDTLYAIAASRACLASTAMYLAQIAESNLIIHEGVERVILTAQTFCSNIDSQCPKKYLVKLLCRQYGVDVYHRLSRSDVSALKWIALAGATDQTEVPDKYLVVGQTYKNLREAVAKRIIDGDTDAFKSLLETTSNELLEIHLQLAVHREITCANVRKSGQISTKGIERLTKFLMGSDMITNKDFLKMLLTNQLQPTFLNMTPGTDIHQQGLQCLLVHFKIVMALFDGKSTILDPLKAVVTGHENIMNVFLPTMPHEVEELCELVKQNNRTRIYCCPNGHPYTIGDCGRPDYIGTCNLCKEKIGGTSHNLLPGNTEYKDENTTRKGHIIGRSVRNGVIQPVRELNPIHSIAVRLLLHMAMFLGPVDRIYKLIKPAVKEREVSAFLLDHIQSNIEDLRRALGRSADDVLSLMHAVIDIMMKESGTTVNSNDTLLSTTAIRRTWEKSFSDKVLAKVLLDVNGCLVQINNDIANDKRLGTEPLMCLMYETETCSEAESQNRLLDMPRMWRFRCPITIEHVRQELDSNIHKMKRPTRVLQRFLHEENSLQALRFLPNIMRFQRALLRKFQKKLVKAEAKRIKVEDVVKEISSSQNTEKWIDDFAKAWEITKPSIKGIPTKFGRAMFPTEWCSLRIDQTTPIAVFLPSTDGMGLCSYAMLDFLFEKQNDLLDFYVKTSGRQNQPASVNPMDVTKSHLISFDLQHDIMPIILANCQYSVETGVGTKIEYDFEGMERQLIDRLLYSKSKIKCRPFMEIDQMVYRNELTNANVFMKLGEKIPQEHLSGDIGRKIRDELRELPDVCESLDSLDVAISFLKTTGGDPTAKLSLFMKATLRMENAVRSQKARQCCELRHAKWLWLFLSFYKSTRIVDNRQSIEDVFETLPQEFFEDIPIDVKLTYEEYLKKLSIEVLYTLLEILHEFMLLVVGIRQNPDDEDFTDTSHYPLFIYLAEYITSEDSPVLDAVVLNGSPRGICYQHSAKAWLMAYQTLCVKIKNRSA